MTAPDTNTIAIIFFNAIGWAIVWLRGEKRDAVQRYQHALMWKQFAKDRKMNGNGITEVT